jgi:O-antigen/teichoic acid export membrane protein
MFGFSAVVWGLLAVAVAFVSWVGAAVIAALAVGEGVIWYLGWRRDQRHAPVSSE